MTRKIATSLGCLSLIGVGAYFNFWAGSLDMVGGLSVFSWIVAGIAVFGLLLAAALCFVLENRGVPAWVPLAAPLICLLLAALGYEVATAEVAGALYGAAPEQRLAFLAMGGVYCLGSSAIGFIWAGLSAGGCCLLAAAHGWKSSGAKLDKGRWLWALFGGIGAILAFVMIAVTGAPPSVVLWTPGYALAFALLVFCGAPLLLLTTGRSTSGLDVRQARRVTSARTMGGLGFLCAAWCLGIAASLLPGASLLSLMQGAEPGARVANPVGPGAPELGYFIAATQKADVILPIIAAVIAVLMLLRVLHWPRSWLPAVLCTVLALGFSAWLLTPERHVRKFLPVGELCMTECLPVDLVMALIARHPLPALAGSDDCDPPLVLRPVEPGYFDVPESEEGICPFHATFVVVSASHVSVDDMCVVQLEERSFPWSVLRDGANGYFVNPLFDQLTEAAQNQKLIASRNPTFRFDGKALVAVDRHSPSRLVDQVVYTAVQAEYTDLWFMVRHPSRVRPPAYRAVPVPAPQPLYGASRPASCADDDPALLLEGAEVEGLCSGTYGAGPCVRLEVPGTTPCGDAAELVAEVWDVALTHDQVRLTSPDGRNFTDPEPVGIVSVVKGYNQNRDAPRVLRIHRHAELPFARELELRRALVSTEAALFSAAFSVVGRDGDEMPQPPPPPPIAASAEDPCGSNDRFARILVDEIPTDEEVQALRDELDGERDAGALP